MVMALSKKRRCPHCRTFFLPNYRNITRQKFCNSNPDCKKASKAASQKSWLAKNPNYFKGVEHVQRVQQWRMDNPGYSKSKAQDAPLQDRCHQNASNNQCVTQQTPPSGKPSLSALQDNWSCKHPVFIGIIAHITGLALQDDIAAVALRLEQLGQDVLKRSNLMNGGNCYDQKVPSLSRTNQINPETVQLGGSPASQGSPP